jgi:predicted dehydrogenase
MKRRDFLRAASLVAAGAAGFPTIVRASALGRAGRPAPSERIVMAGIGFGMQGVPNMRNFLENGDVQWVAVCDVDRAHLEEARRIVNDHYGASVCNGYRDYREILDRRDLDAVSIAVPDHWHAILALSAIRAGLDVYGEKPLTHGLREGRALCDAVKRYGRVWQTGSWQRSVANFHQAAELVRNGRLGTILLVEVGLPEGHWDFAGTFGREAVSPVPESLDYDRWLGPAPAFPYREAAVHMNWRWNMAFGGGQLMDWVGHHVDIAHWGLGLDTTGPVSIEARGEYAEGGIYDSPVRYCVDAIYADGTPLVVAGGYPEIWPGTKWIGERGWIWVDRGEFRTEPARLRGEAIGPGEVRLKWSRDHSRDFLDCIRSRAETIAPCEVAHRSASVGHLGVAAMGVGRKIRWDPATETIIGDAGAERLLTRSYRAPWQLPA